MKLANKLPFWHFDEDQELMVYKDGSLGAGFKLTGFDLNCKTEEEINKFTSGLKNLLTNFESGCKIQVFYRLSPDVDNLISTNEEMSSDCSERYKSVLDARTRFLRKNADDKKYFSPEIYFFLRSAPYSFKKKNLFDKGADYKTVTEDEYEKFSEKFLRLVKQAESILSGSGVKPLRLDADHWFDLCFSYLNLERSEKIGFPSLRAIEDIFSEPLAAQMFLTDIKAEPKGVKIGNYTFKVVTLKTLPENYTYAAMVDEFTKLPFHFWISQNIRVLDQQAE